MNHESNYANVVALRQRTLREIERIRRQLAFEAISLVGTLDNPNAFLRDLSRRSIRSRLSRSELANEMTYTLETLEGIWP